MFNSELKIVSRVAKLHTPAAPIYRVISDFSFMNKITPPDDKVKILNSDSDSCTISVEGGGQFGMKIIERKENELVKIGTDDAAPFAVNIWIQLKEVEAYDTRLRITLHSKMNPLIKVVAQKPLTNFVESLVDKLEQRFNASNVTYDTNYEA